MTAKQCELRLLLTATVVAALVQACDSGVSGPEPGVNGTYLHVSVPEFYFGTKDVGTVATQPIQIANHGADIYPIKSVSISGENAEEFSTDLFDDVVLNPADAITVRVSFQPITDGRKFANFEVDYETIKQVSDAVNQNEQNYYEGRELEAAGNYRAAKQEYSDYIAGDPVTINKRRAAIKLPVIQESEVYGDGEDFGLYLSALDHRESGDLTQATTDLDVLQTLFAKSYLADDALYLKGYIQLMDNKDYPGAVRTMQALRKTYPDSTYYDTALYSEAIAQQEIGNTAIAREILLDLRFRHTGFDTLGVTLAKDNLVSRLWFDRANEALDAMNAA